MSKKIDFENLQESYNFACAACGHEQNAKPSLMMKSFHENTGCGSCLKCRKLLHLKIAEDGKRMESRLWDEYLENNKSVVARVANSGESAEK